LYKQYIVLLRTPARDVEVYSFPSPLFLFAYWPSPFANKDNGDVPPVDDLDERSSNRGEDTQHRPPARDSAAAAEGSSRRHHSKRKHRRGRKPIEAAFAATLKGDHQACEELDHQPWNNNSQADYTAEREEIPSVGTDPWLAFAHAGAPSSLLPSRRRTWDAEEETVGDMRSKMRPPRPQEDNLCIPARDRQGPQSKKAKPSADGQRSDEEDEDSDNTNSRRVQGADGCGMINQHLMDSITGDEASTLLSDSEHASEYERIPEAGPNSYRTSSIHSRLWGDSMNKGIPKQGWPQDVAPIMRIAPDIEVAVAHTSIRCPDGAKSPRKKAPNEIDVECPRVTNLLSYVRDMHPNWAKLQPFRLRVNQLRTEYIMEVKGNGSNYCMNINDYHTCTCGVVRFKLTKAGLLVQTCNCQCVTQGLYGPCKTFPRCARGLVWTPVDDWTFAMLFPSAEVGLPSAEVGPGDDRLNDFRLRMRLFLQTTTPMAPIPPTLLPAELRSPPVSLPSLSFPLLPLLRSPLHAHIRPSRERSRVACRGFSISLASGAASCPRLRLASAVWGASHPLSPTDLLRNKGEGGFLLCLPPTLQPSIPPSLLPSFRKGRRKVPRGEMRRHKRARGNGSQDLEVPDDPEPCPAADQPTAGSEGVEVRPGEIDQEGLLLDKIMGKESEP
ncbi:MAG: hypothetical protein KIY12_10175, partial [Thermoplasmata archaeon]|nr:hypothetical protein [Candidatus Sysuiplasma superficiale]